MPALPIKRIALVLIVIYGISNYVARQYGNTVFTWVNEVDMILLTLAALLAADGFNKVIATAVLGYMLCIVPDTAFFALMQFQWNDVIAVAASLVAAGVVWYRYRYPLRIDGNSVFLIVALLTKAITQHSYAYHVVDGQRVYLALQGDIVAQFIFAIYLLRTLRRVNLEIPFLLYGLTFIKATNDVFDSPYHWNIQEERLLVLMGMIALWWVVYRFVYKQNIMFHVLGALTVIFIALCLCRFL